MQNSRVFLPAVVAALAFVLSPQSPAAKAPDAAALAPVRPEIYAPVALTADLAPLTAKEREMVSLFIDASVIMDDLFWQQAYPGDRAKLLTGIADPATRRFVEVNYGPWDRLAGNVPFVSGVGPKPDVAGFYPLDMTREEFDRANLPGSRSEYTVLERDAKGALQVVPYSKYYGAASAHGQANMLRFNFFAERGAFARDASGHYRVDMAKMRRAVDELSGVLLNLQGDGDYAGVAQLTKELGVIRPQLQADLDRLSNRAIPVDVVFTQGKAVLGLN
jgi:hypothetical protein